MLQHYDDALKHVLKFEGGYSNHPQDPGGATMKGVTQRVYDAWRIRHGQPKQSVRRISGEEVALIYATQYWKPVCGTVLPGGVELCTFDAAVNSGVGQASKWLQRAVGAPADGIVGVVTLAACDAQDADVTINRSCDLRLAMLKRLKTWPTFGKGWSRRVEATRKASLALVDADLDVVDPVSGRVSKALPDDPADGYA